jgi:ligand-binding sensor domain-containing protein
LKTILFAVALIIISNTLYSQNLYPEKFEDCKLTTFCLDCGTQKAQPPKSILQSLFNGMGEKNLAELKGTIDLQILIDQNGKPCLLSAENKTNISSADLKLKESVNGGENWAAAATGSKRENSSVCIILKFENGKYEAKRRIFDFANQANMSSKGTPDQKGSDKAQLTENWQLYDQANSELPWDMTRAIASDQKGDVWIGTDNGIVKITNGKWEHYNSSNTIIASTANNKKETKSVRDMVVDQKDNKWFVIGYDVYKYDNHIWSKFDSLNSPINWARTSYADHLGNVFFTSWDGVAKFDGEKWSQLTKKNAKLPSDKTLGVFVDSKERTWIGTFEGNVMIEKGKTTLLNDKSSPLSKAYISQMHEDKKGNLWFSLHNEEGTAAGIYKLSLDGVWERLLNDDPKMFVANSINEFFLDEQNGTLWVSQNNVGILKYAIASKKLEVYTNENSNVPSVHVAQITKDKDGAIWAATFAGVIKTGLK